MATYVHDTEGKWKNSVELVFYEFAVYPASPLNVYVSDLPLYSFKKTFIGVLICSFHFDLFFQIFPKRKFSPKDSKRRLRIQYLAPTLPGIQILTAHLTQPLALLLAQGPNGNR